MKKSKNSLTVILMISSITLLLVLQLFWLKSSYERAFFDFRRETNMLFRNTVVALRDSALAKNIQVIPNSKDSLQTGRIIFQEHIDSVFVRKNKGMTKQKTSSVRVFISSTTNGNRDSISSILKPLASRLQHNRFSDNSNFIIRLGPDSLNLDTLRLEFGKVLKKNRMDIPFRLKRHGHEELPNFLSPDRFGFMGVAREEGMKRPRLFADSLTTDHVRINPAHRYTASFGHVRGLLLREITPQILFSLFLTVITVAAFVLLYRSIRSQQRLMELKNDFISNMTHELKTPIATVSVALEALKNFKGIDNPRLTSEYLDIAQHELNRLAILTDKVLKTSLFEDRGVDYIPEAVNLEETIKQVLNSMKLVFEKQKATVEFEKQGEDFNVKGGTIHLTNVIYNLLDNALKYSVTSPAVVVSLEDLGEKIKLTVKDNGIGIPSEYKHKIFEKFFRVPSGDVHNSKGYGLGLSYVDSVIRSHRGTIEVESEQGKGSAFMVTIPKNN